MRMEGWVYKHFSSAASQANYPVTVGELLLQVYSHYSCNYWNCREDAANNPPLETQKETPAANEESSDIVKSRCSDGKRKKI